ncbi:MAG: heme-binding protein [Proteobacteria bacterium]|nr:heme-binding protein [Pseudomonadota bacterium]
MRPFRIGTALVTTVTAGLGLLGLTGTGVSGHYEEPEYQVIAEAADYQVRHYAGRIEARVTVQASYGTSVQTGFRILANYIFGGNQARASIDMTTPVSAAESLSIDMTTPVTARGEGTEWVVSFMMPSEWTLASLPVPNDPRVELVEAPPSLRAVRTFGGRATTRSTQSQLATLRTAIEADGYVVTGPAAISQFDPPWVLGPWRRNEVQWPVRHSSGKG